MKKLFIHLGIINADYPLFNKNVVEISRRVLDNNIDMQAFTQWCNEFGVSRLVSKNNEFTVTIGNHQKLVKLDHF